MLRGGLGRTAVMIHWSEGDDTRFDGTVDEICMQCRHSMLYSQLCAVH